MITILSYIGIFYMTVAVVVMIPISGLIRRWYSDKSHTVRALMAYRLALAWPYLLIVGLIKAGEDPDERA